MWTWRRRCATPPHSGGRRPPRVVPVLGGKGSTSTGNSSRSLMYDRERRPTSTLWITCSFYFCLCFQDASFWQIVDRARQIYLFPGCLFLADCTVHGRSTVVHPVIRTCVFLSPPTCRTRRADAGRRLSALPVGRVTSNAPLLSSNSTRRVPHAPRVRERTQLTATMLVAAASRARVRSPWMHRGCTDGCSDAMETEE